jgi:hypothetical protein
MPLTKQELIERCDKLYEESIKIDGINVMELGLLVYITTAAFFEEITKEESSELVNIYLNKIRDYNNKKKVK